MIKKISLFTILLWLPCAVALAAEQPPNNKKLSKADSNPAPAAMEGIDAFTAAEALKASYDKAVQWHKDAVLWSIKSYGYDIKKKTSEMWNIEFGTNVTEKLFLVSIQGRKINEAKEVMSTRQSPHKAEFPTHAPPVTLEASIKSCIQATGIYKLYLPALASEYYVDDDDGPFKGIPRWTSRLVGSGDQKGSMKKYCTVDALTGKVLRVKDF